MFVTMFFFCLSRSFTYKLSLVRIDARNLKSYPGNRPTNKNKRTHRQDRLQYTAPLSLACSGMKCTPFLSSALTPLVGQQEGLPACKKLGVGIIIVDGDDLTGTLHVL